MSNETYLWILGVTIFGYLIPAIINVYYFNSLDKKNPNRHFPEGESLMRGFLSFAPIINILAMIVIINEEIIKLWKNKQ